MVDQECDDGAIPVTLATLKADGVELIAIRLEAADALSLRAAISAVVMITSESTHSACVRRVAACARPSARPHGTASPTVWSAGAPHSRPSFTCS